VGELPVWGLGQGGDHGDTGQPLAALYTAADVELDEARDLGVPGEPPFVRGTYPKGYVQRPWLMAQYVGFGTVEETNARWKSLIAAGQRSVSLAFDLPSHLGLDSDDELAEDEVGKAGVAIDSLADFEVLFDGIDLARIPATFNTAAPAPVIVAMYQVVGERQGVSAERLMGTITNDSLSAAFRGTCVLPAAPALSAVVDVVEYCTRHMPRFTPINVQGVYMRSVGATKAQEVGYALAYALAYLDEAIARGLSIEQVAPRFSFFFQCDSHIFEEAAKFRAARRVWSEVIAQRYATDHHESRMLRATGVSAARCFTKEEPEINLIRGAYSALGCALGGVQGMWISGYDEAFATPTEHASRLALRTMQILAEETGIRATIDPAGGSFFLEHLTNTLTEQIHHHINEVADNGGAVGATDSGYLRRQMLNNDQRWATEREHAQRHIVAHNIYRSTDPQPEEHIEFQRFRPEVRNDQITRLHHVKNTRDPDTVTHTLNDIRHAAQHGHNLMPPILNAVRAYATIGEITTQLRHTHGQWTEPTL
jgi:methylmalonyl-CoA mutase N-terminal domain/subunit